MISRLLTPILLIAIVLSMTGCAPSRQEQVIYPVPTAPLTRFPQVTVVQSPDTITPAGSVS